MTTTSPALPFFLDCDTGIDDALALAYLLADPGVDLVGVATVSGNVSAPQGARNTLDLLALAGRTDVPVAVGACDPLVGSYTGAVPHIHGANGLGDVTIPRADAEPVAASGPELLIEQARALPGQLRVVAVGPLTNLATALRLAPDLPGLVHAVTVMGGAVDVPGNVTPAAEANIWNDPEAAATVLTAPWPLTLVPLDVTLRHVLTEPERLRLVASPDPLLHALGEVLSLYFDFYATTYHERLCALHDPLAAVVAAQAVRTLEERTGASFSVVLDGDERGRTRYGSSARPPLPTRVIDAVDPVAPVLMEAFAAWRDDALLTRSA